MTPFLRSVQTSVQKLTTEMCFTNDELLIILKRVTLEICKHLSFLIIDEIVI